METPPLINSVLWRDAAAACLWLLCNIALLALASRLTSRLCREAPLAFRALTVAVLYVASIIVLIILPGSVGFLYPSAVLGVGFLGAIAAIRALGLHSSRGLSNDNTAAFHFASPLCAAWAFAGLVLLGYEIQYGLLAMPSDYDCLAYHMPLVDSWLQSRSLYAPDLDSNWFLAANNELISVWLTGPFSGDFLIPLTNFPSVLIIGFASFSICRSLQLTPLWSHAAALSALATPILWQQVVNASNDLAVEAFFLAASAYILRYLIEQRLSPLLLGGICVGVLAGTKYYALGYAVVVIVAAIVAVSVENGARTALNVGLALGAQAAIFGGYWYLRNIVVTGAPVFPMSMSGGLPTLAYPDVWGSTFLGNKNPQLWSAALAQMWNITGPWYTVCLLSQIVVLPLLLWRSFTSAVARPICVFVLLLLAGSIAVWVVTPYAVEDRPGSLNQLGVTFTMTRYGLCPLVLSSITFLVCVSRWITFATLTVTRQIATASVMALLGCQIINEVSGDQRVATCLAFATGASFLGLLAIHLSPLFRARRLRLMGVVLALALTVLAMTVVSARWHHKLATALGHHYESAFLSNLQLQSPSECICVFDEEPYPFYGSGRQNRVINPRLPPRTEELLEFLTARQPTVVAIGRDGTGSTGRYEGTDRKMLVVTDRFREVEVGVKWRIFRLRDSPPQ